MKWISFIVVTSVCGLISCGRESFPIAPPSPPPPPPAIEFSGYGTTFDSHFLKVWSDSSWMRFNRYVTMGSQSYTALLSAFGDEHYYVASGYAGFKLFEGSVVLFDTIIPPLPDSLRVGQLYRRRTTFTSESAPYVMTLEHTVLDTETVSTLFATFTRCMHMHTQATLQTPGEISVQSGEAWLARGPADIKTNTLLGGEVVMVRGRVNGRGWGMGYPEPPPAIPKRSPRNANADILKSILLM